MNNRDNISPKLAGLKKELPFKVPQKYFDDFPARMQHRLEQEKQASSKTKTRVIDFIKPALSLAAGFAAIFILVYWPVKTLNNRQSASNTTTRIEQVVSDDFINLFEMFDEETFYALLEKEPNGDYLETETLVAYLADNYSEYDIFMETKN
jgi:hypothetical protein